ncbi:unnamed protein product [Soboliphyme baturini]|uniref:DUF229 domain containing protein n=1 Tax=Soboliphyme baturini TaxID=241478 RepID=A0A183IFX1_9BILA|nr:unnamed protein product [Soboliphyme baturini]
MTWQLWAWFSSDYLMVDEHQSEIASGPLPKCNMPVLTLDDPLVREYSNPVAPINCSHEKNWVYLTDGNIFMIATDAIKKHGPIRCSATSYKRVSDFTIFAARHSSFEPGQKIPTDVIAVDCTAADGSRYKNVLAAIVRDEAVLRRAKSKILPADALGLNVFILGFDSMSRMMFMRKLKRTYKFLTDDLRAFVLKGYNIVGDGTTKALTPLLTGSTQTELPETHPGHENATYVDVYPFIWNDFKDIGYITLFGEDWPGCGTFSMRMKGFKKQPTDHYQRTFYIAEEARNNKSNPYCIGNEPHHKVHFAYFQDFVTSYLTDKDLRVFAFSFHSILSHDSFDYIEFADDDTVQLLKFLRDNGYLENTILMFMSDHGQRMADYRQTEQGKVEERLPFFSIYLPPAFRKKYPNAVKNLRLNVKRLTTPFDIHATMRHMIHFTNPKRGSLLQRGISLFDEIPLERSCADAGIEPHFCACVPWFNVAVDDPVVKRVAAAVVSRINERTAKARKFCAELSLSTIIKASDAVVSEIVMKFKKMLDSDGLKPDLSGTDKAMDKHYQVHIVTKPGDAHYEASVAVRKGKEVLVDLESVSRINSYKALSHCIMDKDVYLAKWCITRQTIKLTNSQDLQAIALSICAELTLRFYGGGVICPHDAFKSETSPVPEAKCSMPVLMLDDPIVGKFSQPVAPLNCSSEKNWVYVKDGDIFMIDPEVQKKHGAISCSIESFERVSDYRTWSRKLAYFASDQRIPSEFFAVDCKASDGSRYKNIHAGIVRNEQTILRAKSKGLPSDALGMNVFILGFDSMSRMMFMRKLKKAYKFLTDDLQAIVLEGYNIVGDGTTKALVALLTGSKETELPETRIGQKNSNFVNVYPLIWNDFKNIGYITLFGEDEPAFGAFAYRLNGFDEQPTDHYQRTFYLMEKIKRYRCKRYCVGNEPHHKTHFAYFQNFVTSYLKDKDLLAFAFSFHSVISHENINDIQNADDDMVQLLKFLLDKGYLENTVLMFMSDHGQRAADYRQTEQGKVEERLPFFSIYLPPAFRKKYPEAVKNLLLNSKRLTTPFDIHATLRHMIHFTNPKRGSLWQRGISLFDEIPLERSCADAGIEPHFCACVPWFNVAVDDPVVKRVAAAVVSRINERTAKARKFCAELSLSTIIKASDAMVSEEVMKFTKTMDLDGFVPDLRGTAKALDKHYQVNIVTEPADAHYEASVVVRDGQEILVDLDSVSRINPYKDLPHCIIDKDVYLAKWCVCYDRMS